jgi:Ca-activated chloride channel family protein
MSFGAPAFLAGLLLVPLALWAYAAQQRRGHARAAQFANPVLMPALQPRRPGWRRHVPALFWVVALAALLFALAKPQRTVAVPVEQATVMLVTDVSGSMLATDVRPDRLTAARNAAARMVADLPRRVRAGLVAFNHQAQVLQPPTSDHDLVLDAITSLRASGSTATGDGLQAALSAIQASAAPGRAAPPAVVVLLSDGKSVRGRDPIEVARQAAKLRVPVYTVALGTPSGVIERPAQGGGTRLEPVPPDRESLAEIARITRGRTFTATQAGELAAIYERLGSQVATKREKREVTSVFAGGALLLVLLGAGLGLRWFARPI